MVPGFLGILKSRSALAELRSAAGGFEAVLLAFLHSRVAGQETGGLQSGAVLAVQAWPVTPPPWTVQTTSTLPSRSVVTSG